MARSAVNMAENLIEIYSDLKKRFHCSKDDFKKIAGKSALKDAYLNEVDSYLREDGYTLIDLRNEEDRIAVIKINTALKWPSLNKSILNDYQFSDWDEED